MKLFCAVILHPNSIHIAILDEQQTEILDTQIDNNRDDVLAALAPHRRDLESILIEAHEDPAWLMQALQEAGHNNVYTLDQG
jgi:hypothetical protein